MTWGFEMNKRRLLKLADLLEEDAANAKGVKFDLRVVACHAKKHKEAPTSPYDDGRYFRPGERPTLDCGTAAGAVGLAVLSGAFKRQGFTYQIDPDHAYPLDADRN